MSKSEDRTFPRRTFIRGAAGLLGATAVGVPSSALSALLAPLALDTQVSCAYWNGSTLVPADSLKVGDPNLISVRLTLAGHGSGRELAQIKAYPIVGTPKGQIQTVFYAWTAPPDGCARTRFVLPVDPSAGILLSAVVHGNPSDTPLRFSVASSSGPKLREGSYVLALGKIDWRQYSLVPGAVEPLVSRVDGVPATCQYVVVTVERT